MSETHFFPVTHLELNSKVDLSSLGELAEHDYKALGLQMGGDLTVLVPPFWSLDESEEGLGGGGKFVNGTYFEN